MIVDKYSELRKRLKAGKGVMVPLKNQKTLFLTPFKVFDLKTPQILIALTPTHEDRASGAGVVVWNPANPPKNAMKLALQMFPTRECVQVHALLCRIFFPIKPEKGIPITHRLDYPKTAKGEFKKVRTGPKSKKSKPKKSDATKRK